MAYYGAMHVAELWRYPVKSMAGEPLTRTLIDEHGIPGDRIVHVRDARGRVVTSRSRPRLLLHKATLGEDGEPRIDGRPWRDVTVPEGALVRGGEIDRFDVLPLLVVTDGVLAAFGRDRRRLRPNIVIGGVAGLAEVGWPGRTISIGDAKIHFAQRRERCIMTTFDPDTAEQDRSVLLDIHARFDGKLALDADVVAPGTIAVGDPVTLL